jgi:uncharacterized protein YceH (UPF0502 family)
MNGAPGAPEREGTMNDATATPAPAAATTWKPLDATQRRVLGVLIEKAKTTPNGYPMSINAIVTGSNQKNNRDPVTQLDDFAVEKALDDLRNLGVVSEVDAGRVAKYKHHAYEWLGVNKVELAVIAELLLRGAQTLGDLRARAARMEPIADLGELKPLVDGLVQRGLMLELTPAGRGQMVSHNLYPAGELEEVRARHGRGAPASNANEVAELRAENERLRARIRDLEARLGDTAGLTGD